MARGLACLLRELCPHLAARSADGRLRQTFLMGGEGRIWPGRHAGLQGEPMSPDPTRQGHHLCKVTICWGTRPSGALPLLKTLGQPCSRIPDEKQTLTPLNYNIEESFSDM